MISLGLGQQSSALYLMSSLGIIERADYAIFADTGAESKATYSFFEWLKSWAIQNNGIPILKAGTKNLYNDMMSAAAGLLDGFIVIPVFTKDEKGNRGLMRRECTSDYKVEEIHKAIRSLYELKPRQRTPNTEIWLGITLEEKERARYSSHKWLTNVYPFLNLRATQTDFFRTPYTSFFRRVECTQWLTENNFPIPPKSACTFCPFQSDRNWMETKMSNPEEWQKVVALDEALRNNPHLKAKQPMYLHRSATPLRDAELNSCQLDLFSAECIGICGI